MGGPLGRPDGSAHGQTKQVVTTAKIEGKAPRRNLLIGQMGQVNLSLRHFWERREPWDKGGDLTEDKGCSEAHRIRRDQVQ
jgi:hypothetical protein